jgi:hypothetical protein
MNIDIIADLLSSDGYTSVHTKLAKKIGFLNAGFFQIILSKYNYYKSTNQLVTIDNKKYFYFTNKDIADKGLTISEVKICKKKLQELGLIENIIKGNPAKTHYTLPNNFINKISKILEENTTFVDKDQVGQIEPTSWTNRANKLDESSHLLTNEINNEINNDSLSTDSNSENILEKTLKVLELTEEQKTSPNFYVLFQFLKNKLDHDLNDYLTYLENNKKSLKEFAELQKRISKIQHGGWIEQYRNWVFAGRPAQTQETKKEYQKSFIKENKILPKINSQYNGL